jgi:hypothetical protein
VGLGLIALIAMVGLVIDGGYAWGRQRITQNGADSVSKAGATVILRWLDGETMKLGDIGCAVEQAAADHDVELEDVQVTDHEGNLIGVTVPDCLAGGNGDIPTDAQGVKATSKQEFDTFLMRVVGIQELTARADATAVVGPLLGTGVALPVTFPQIFRVCDDQQVLYEIDDWDDVGTPNNTWEPYEILPDPEVNAEGEPDADNLAIIPLCTTGPGSVGWLDFGCAPNLAETISNPCGAHFPIPSWIQTQTGEVNSLEDELAEYHGNLPGVYEPEGSDPDADHRVQLPIHTNTCEEDAGVSDTDGDGINELNDCPDGVWTAGSGDNLFYGVPFWVGFIIDEAHVQGGDNECEELEGTPLLDNPGGQVGCIKGWFVARHAPPTDVGIGDINPGDDTDIAVVLIN